MITNQNQNNDIYRENLITRLSKLQPAVINLFAVLDFDMEDFWESDNNSDNFEDLFQRITKMDGFTTEQLSRITNLMIKIHPSIEDVELKKASLEFMMSNLNLENVYDCLKIAQSLGLDESSGYCLEYIGHMTGLKIEDSGSLCVDTHQSITLELIEHMDSICSIYSTLSIQISSNACTDSVALENFMQKHGDKIHFLDLSNMEVNDLFAAKAITYCPNLVFLKINSHNITKIGLASLNNLTNLKILDLTGCVNVTKLPSIDRLKSLEHLILDECEGLKALPCLNSLVNLVTLNLNDCSNITLDSLDISFLVNLTFLHLEGWGELLALDLSQNQKLKIIDLHACWNIKHLRISHLPELTTINFSGCGELQELFELTSSPKLEELNLEGCYSLTELSSFSFLKLLKKINLMECSALTFASRFDALSSLLDHDFLYWIYNIDLFQIQDEEVVLKLIVSKISNQINNPTTSPEKQLKLSAFIEKNTNLFDIEDPLLTLAQNIQDANKVRGPKNPIKIFKRLEALSKQICLFETPFFELDHASYAINMNQLQILANGMGIKRKDLPVNATIENWETLINRLKQKYKSNKIQAKSELEMLGTNWTTISYILFDSPEKYLSSLLLLKTAEVTEVEACWRAVFSHIISLDQHNENTFFNEQEEALIKMIMGMERACKTGQDAGILSSYLILDRKEKYQINLGNSQFTDVMDLNAESERKLAIKFLENFIANQADKTPDTLAESLMLAVNQNMENSRMIGSLIMDEQYWKDIVDENDAWLSTDLNKSGALKLLDIEKMDKARALVSQFIGQAIQKTLEAQFSGTNALMKELCGQSLITQGSHLQKYLRNLIGHLVGVSQNVSFDWYTGTLSDTLIEKDRGKVLKIFFRYVTPKLLCKELIKIVNEAEDEIKETLALFLNASTFDEDTALELLTAFNYLNKK